VPRGSTTHGSPRGTQTCTKLASLRRNTVMESHDDSQIITEPDFRCISSYQKHAAFPPAARAPGTVYLPVPLLDVTSGDKCPAAVRVHTVMCTDSRLMMKSRVDGRMTSLRVDCETFHTGV